MRMRENLMFGRLFPSLWSHLQGHVLSLLLVACCYVTISMPGAFGFTMESSIKSSLRSGKANDFSRKMMNANRNAVQDDIMIISDSEIQAQSHSMSYPYSNLDVRSTQKVLLDELDVLLDANIPNMEERKQQILQMIDVSHAKDLEFCAAFGSEHDLDVNLSPSIQGGNGARKRIAFPPYTYVYSPHEIDGHDDANDDNGIGRYKNKRPLAIRTIDSDQPVLDQDSISIIRNAAESLWKGESDGVGGAGDGEGDSTSNSRFTYQRKGNCEAHLIDLAVHADRRIEKIVRSALDEKIYPMVRDAFQPLLPELEHLNLSIYDSLVIRYNATAAFLENRMKTLGGDGNYYSNSNGDGDGDEFEQFLGAGQPMHRDLGLISVNIMLNSKEEFVGGGTFLENQLRGWEDLDGGKISASTNSPDSGIDPLKPLGIGHAIAHLSSERHAGVGTTNGVRDILVLFLTATRIEEGPIRKNGTALSSRHQTPRLERAARLKNTARDFCDNYNNSHLESIFCRTLHHRLALQHSPDDGEAWQYLGMTLRLWAVKNMANEQLSLGQQDQQASPSLSPREMMKLSISCLEQAYALNPQDGRLCNNISLAYETLLSAPKQIADRDDDCSTDIEERIDFFYERAFRIHQECERLGCDVGFDFACATLNYGLYKSNQDNFRDAAKILQRFRHSKKAIKFNENPEQDRIEADGLRLLDFCESRLAN